MVPWKVGRSTIDFLLSEHKLETLVLDDSARSAAGLIERAERRLATARGGLAVGDPEGAFAASYDACRMAADSLLARQGLRATSGAGSHATVEDAVSAQFADRLPEFEKPIFERFRRIRNSIQYFDPDAPEIDVADAEWAIRTAARIVADVADLLDSDAIGPYRLT